MQARNGTTTISGIAGDLPLGENNNDVDDENAADVAKIMKAESMFTPSMDPDLGEISGGRLAEPHAFPWYFGTNASGAILWPNV